VSAVADARASVATAGGRRPLRILKAADVDGPAVATGGMNEFMRRSAAAVEERGHRVELLFRDGLAPAVRRGGLRRLVAPWALWRKVRRSGSFDVVEVHEPLAAAYCLMRRVQRSLPPCVVVSYGAEERHWRSLPHRRRRSRVTVPLTLLTQSRFALRHADHLLVPSERDNEYLGRELGVPPARRTRVDPGVDAAYGALTAAPRGRDELRVLFVGSWIDRKGAGELAQVWPRFAQAHPGASLTLSCTVADARTVVADVGCERVTVEPFATEERLLQTLSAHDVFVLPSWFEGGMSLAALKAAAAGLACVVTAVSGHVDLFRPPDPERDGALLVPPHDAGALLLALERLAGDRALVDRLGANARRRASTFTWAASAEACITAYRRAAAARPAWQ